MSICPAVIRSEGEVSIRTPGRGHDREEPDVYIPYQFMKAMEDDRMRAAARDGRAAVARRERRRRRRARRGRRPGRGPAWLLSPRAAG
jgi:hypothetical protein